MADILCDVCGEPYDEDPDADVDYYDGSCDDCLNDELGLNDEEG